MGPILGGHFDEEECLALLRLTRRGRIVLSIRAMPVAFPVPYLVQGTDLLIGVSEDQITRVMHRSVIGLQADGWLEDSQRHWTALAIGEAQEVVKGGVQASTSEPPLVGPFAEEHVFRLRPDILSGRWITTP